MIVQSLRAHNARAWVALVAMLIAGLVQCAPLIVAAKPALAQRLYATTALDATQSLLLRHRAVLLGMVGVLLLVGASVRPLRTAAIVMGLASKSSYLLLLSVEPAASAQCKRVGAIDVVTAILLVIAWWIDGDQRGAD